MGHPLVDLFLLAAQGTFPPVDGGVTYLPPLDGGIEAIVAFTGHSVIASRHGRDALADLRPDGFGGALTPEIQLRLAEGGSIGTNDVTLVARGGGGGALPKTDIWDDHRRVRFARLVRRDVEVHGDERGFVTISRGLAGRREMSIELADGLHDSGIGRAMIAETLALVPAGEMVFAAVSPGNARSLRSFLSQGFVPLASEVVIIPPAAAEAIGFACGSNAHDR